MSPHVTLLLPRQSQGVPGQLLSRRRIYDQIICAYANRTDFTHVFGGNDVLVPFPLYTGLHIDHQVNHLIGVKVLRRQYLQMWMLLYLSLIHISEPTRRTPISYAVFCLKKKKKK